MNVSPYLPPLIVPGPRDLVQADAFDEGVAGRRVQGPGEHVVYDPLVRVWRR